MIKVPELTKELADDIAYTAKLQLQTSRQFKTQRLKQIEESEDLYFGVVKKTLKNPFNDSFPFMPGFVDTIVSKLDEAPSVELEHNDEGDYKYAKKYEAFLSQEMQSPLPNAQWGLKDRWCRKMAIFSGVGVYSVNAEVTENEDFVLDFRVFDYYDFHCEPAGGGDLESHLFCGNENIFLTKEALKEGARDAKYDALQVQDLLSFGKKDEYKEQDVESYKRYNRHRALALDPESNNYTGQEIFKFVQWYLTYQGVRWYVLFEENTGKWIRIKPLRDILPIVPQLGESLWPYVAWHTHEEASVFWSKAPADDARPIAKNMNRLLNQELYNREKRNMGQRAYDPEIYYDAESLADWRPDGLVPFDSKGGSIPASNGIYEFKTGDLTGTVDFVQFLDGFAGQKTGVTPGTQGKAPADQKVGIFYGELQQVEARMGLLNRSYKEAWQGIVYRSIMLMDKYITKPISIKMYGSEGAEWAELTPEDKQRKRDFGIKIKGGQDELQETLQKNARKAQALGTVQTVNPRWKDVEALRAGGYSDEELKDAFNNLPIASQELIAEAKQALDEITNGKQPKLNPGANMAFIQRIIDEADEADDDQLAIKFYDYATAHAEIVAENEARNLKAVMLNKQMGAMADPNNPMAMSPQGQPAQKPAGITQ